MTDFTTIFTATNARKIWRQLRASEVPIVTDIQHAEIDDTVSRLLSDILSHNYMPSIGHGYLGYPKQGGTTRFVPILTKEDLTVYYLLTFALQDALVFSLPGVFGGWRSVPTKLQNKGTAPQIVDPYYSNAFTKRLWFKEWRSFNALLGHLTRQSDIGNYVVITDVANFYDTIDNNLLCNNIQAAVGDSSDVVSLLRVFLGLWDRRTKGYHLSSKGIPQEIISDASRLLSHFYLRPFDEYMIRYGSENSIQYTRWSDDIVMFGKSRKQLEKAVHQASRRLLNIGLNLNASKTRHFTRSEFTMYRALDFLAAVQSKDTTRFARELRKFMTSHQKIGGRIDTVYRAAIGFMSKNESARTPYALTFLEDQSNEYLQAGNLADNHIMAKTRASPDPKSAVEAHLRLILRYPYAAPRAQFLRFLKRHSPKLVSLGISQKVQLRYAQQVVDNDGGSELIRQFSGPSTIASI